MGDFGCRRDCDRAGVSHQHQHSGIQPESRFNEIRRDLAITRAIWAILEGRSLLQRLSADG